jgi:hypothetical protein
VDNPRRRADARPWLRSRFAPAGLLVGLLLAAEVQAIEGGRSDWSTLSGKTVGLGRTAIFGQVGFPGFSASLLHGIAPALDLGAKLTFNYAEEGIVSQVVAGVKAQAVARLSFFDNGRVNFGMQFEPGPLVYFTSFETTAGLSLPVGLRLGISLSQTFLASVGVEAPVFRVFGTAGGWVFPILFGGGLEYFVAPDLAATFNVRLGPSVDTRGFKPVSNLAFEGLFGIAYRL